MEIYGKFNPRKTHIFGGVKNGEDQKAENTYHYVAITITTVVAFSLFSTPLFRFAGSTYVVVHIEYIEKERKI